ncbi:gliding motility-associated C-terminal domain-containing protein [Frigoriflavimonas asaccharolytica]|uniref:Gliding motility-associated-like protein n=1 Tax=Frigoriflavimonas asaccharolytica TaxID=2735899 RepID=A0A8J8K9H2_9FLAO|nr:gliding motility-associated C-terminal domain-containing protein [Frigoriflavimonas asaccharolytica]NRS93631.1 gliding motility-associated-like protein [Frigoriflavimonas asaccharolytica]
MKKIFTLLFTIFYLFGNAQLDTDHWFAPMSARAGINNLQSVLYLSTNETTPFTVQIFNNNGLYTTAQVSKGNPTTVDIPGDYMLAPNQFDLFTVSNKGIYVKGAKKFYANYRFSVTSHAEIITSKGLAGIGTTFYAAMAPNTTATSYVSSNIGVLATEDNTIVTISGYNPLVVFSDGSSSATKTFTLNKGQSYIVDVASQDSPNNLTGLIGAKIVATKPISVTNGNFNGIYTTQNLTNNDILMDQAVPIDRLGKDFAVVKGNGPVTSGMEAVLVVATENNTTLLVNGNPYGSPLNEGQYVVIPGTEYVNQGGSHYNVSINGNKNIYVYQLLSGTSVGNVYPAGGFNYIPPLSCFLPNKIDEIGFINRIGVDFYETKLNIITQTGAAVTLNGAALAASTGPFPITGNSGWVTYSVPNVSGNITVNSTKSVTAGIAAGNGAVGYGGYFAGFSSVPLIVKTGDCYAGILLQVDNSYDAYQWFLNGVAIPGATSFSINPEVYGAGIYTVLITKINCESKLTDPYTYTLCPPITTTIYNIGSCKNLIINPVFTNSTQAINFANTAIIAPPTSGTTSVNSATGAITYTPNPGLTVDTQDTFVYYIQGTGNPADFEYFRANVNIDVLQTTNGTLSSCANTAGNGTYNLTSVSSSPDTGTTATYYSDAALTSAISNPTAYVGPAGIVYVSVRSSFGCTKTAQISLTVIPSPNINTANFNGSNCDVNFDGIIPITFSNITLQIVTNSAIFNVRYYLNQADANAGNNNNLPNNWTYTNTTIVYVRVDSINNNCPSAFGQITFSAGARIPLLTAVANEQVCDSDLSGGETVNLNDYKALFTANPNVNLTFYSTLANAQNSTNAIAGSQNITGVQTYFIRFESATECPSTAQITVSLKAGKKSDILMNATICKRDTTILNAGPGFTSYLWSNGATTPSVNVGVGTYYVDLGFNGCTYRQSVTVFAAELPQIIKIDVNGTTAVVSVSGGTGPYQYSLDGVNYQASNTFTALARGVYKVYVLSADRCEPVVGEFLILGLTNVITPNADGVNDVLDYSDLNIKENVSIEIFDRYGTTIYKSEKNKYVWDGKQLGNPLPTGTYWYIIKWTEPDTKNPVNYSGWVLLKNRN